MIQKLGSAGKGSRSFVLQFQDLISDDPCKGQHSLSLCGEQMKNTKVEHVPDETG